MNYKRLRRLWRDEGLKVPYRKKKKRLTGIGVQVGAMRPIAPNVIWAMDFQFDQTSNLRTIKMLNIIDEFTRECPAIDVARSITADDVVDRLEQLAKERGAPCYLRMDNGPEFVAHALVDWCRFNGAGSSLIDPAHPGKTAGSNRSTHDFATSSRTVNSSTRCSRRRSCSATCDTNTITIQLTARYVDKRR